MPRYLHSSALDAVRRLAAEAAPPGRPRRAARPRGYIPGRHRRPPAATHTLRRVLDALRQMEVAA